MTVKYLAGSTSHKCHHVQKTVGCQALTQLTQVTENHNQEAKPDAKLTCNLVRMRNKRPLAYQHQHPSFWRQLEILRKLKIGSSMGNFL